MNSGANHEAWVERLRGMGFTNYEARIYLALLGEASLTVADIVRKSGVPQPKVYESTRTLTERGFIERVLGNVQSFCAVDPTTAFNNHRERAESELERQAREMKALQASLPSADKLAADTWGVRIVQGTANIRAARRELVHSAKEEVIHFVRPPIWATATPNTAIVSKKLPYRLVRLVEESLLTDPEHGESFSLMAATEEATRVVPQLPMKLIIYDRKTMLFPLQDVSDGAIMVLPQPNLAEQWAEYANYLWDNAKPYAARKGKRKKGSRARES